MAKVLKEIRGWAKRSWTRRRDRLLQISSIRFINTYRGACKGKWVEDWCRDRHLFSIGVRDNICDLGLAGYWINGLRGILTTKPKTYRRYRLVMSPYGNDHFRFKKMNQYDKMGKAMDGLMSATPLCEDVIGEIVSYL